MQLLDCTLRDGANVVGRGFSAELTTLMIEGLIRNNIRIIEMGNAMGMGMDQDKSTLTDEQYLDLVSPYLNEAKIGMFIGEKNAVSANIELAASKGLKFLRVGANAGDGGLAEEGIKKIKQAGMEAHYSMMKGYILSSEDLADEAARLESFGVDEVTLMDSAGTMLSEQVFRYITQMVNKVKIPVGFHGHNNLGLSVANALVAEQAGAAVLDCGLMGMARSAGNLATEMAVGVFQRMGKLQDIDFYGLLSFIDDQLAPQMATYHYKAAVSPYDLILGLSGCHSSFSSLFEAVARDKEVNLYQLIVEVSKINQKTPSRDLMEQVAKKIRS